MNTFMKKWFVVYSRYIIVFAALLLILFKLLYRYDASLDLVGYDEASYVQTALFGPLRIDGIVYYLYLKILNIFIPDAANLYVANFGIVTILFAVSIFVSAAVLLRSALLSVCFATLFTLATFTATMWPFISHFTAAVILILLIAVHFTPAKYRLLSVLIGAILLSYIRPEFSLTFIVVLVAAVVSIVLALKAGRRPNFALLAAVIVCFTIFFMYNPSVGGRSYAAFAQHYALDLSKAGLFDGNPWTEAQIAMSRDFGNATTVPSLVMANPIAFFLHIIRNVGYTFYELSEMMTPLYGQDTIWGSVVAGSIFILGLVWMFDFMSQLWHRSIDGVALFAATVVLPVIISVLVIFPRHHYLIMITPVITLMALRSKVWQVLIAKLKPESLPVIWHRVLFGISLVLLLVFVPWRVNGRFGFRIPKNVYTVHGQSSCTNRDKIKFLHNLKLNTDQVNFLSSMGFLKPFLPEGWNEVLHFMIDQHFDDYLRSHVINAIWVMPNLSNEGSFQDEQGFKKFIANPGLPWQALHLKECTDQYLLIHKDLLISPQTVPVSE